MKFGGFHLLTKDHHHGGPGGQGEGVQDGPLRVGGGPYESGQILDLSNKTLESALIRYPLKLFIIFYHHEGLGGQGEGVRGGPLQIGGEAHEIFHILGLSKKQLYIEP